MFPNFRTFGVYRILSEFTYFQSVQIHEIFRNHKLSVLRMLKCNENDRFQIGLCRTLRH